VSSVARNRVFVSYSHKDAKWLEKLQVNLKPFVRHGPLEIWTDRDISPGDSWREAISQALSQAAVAILLVTPDFLASDFIANNELPPLLAANRDRGLRILWIAVEHSAYTETAIAQYEAVNDPGRPLRSLQGAARGEALVRIAQSISDAIDGVSEPSSSISTSSYGTDDSEHGSPTSIALPSAIELDRLASDTNTRPPGIIPIYRDPTEPLDWFAEMVYSLNTARPMLNPRLPYFGPGLASLWIRVGQSTDYVQEMNAQFGGHMSNLLDIEAGTSLNVVDLGIGDFEKGRIILEKLLRRGARVTYIPVDVSYEMIVIALNRHAGERSLITRLNKTDSIWSINSTFENLPNFQSVLPNTRTLFLLLGNTLGNELDESDMLTQIARVMKKDDELLVEVQLLEDSPPSLKKLTEDFQQKKFFYGAPFFALGYRDEDIDVSVGEDSEQHSRLSVDAWTIVVNADLKSEHEIYHPGLARRIRIPRKRRVVIQMIRTYRGELPADIFTRAGLHVTRSVATVATDPTERRFQYIIAKRS
jgi:hypothetical protein